jgi:hypothetical protein
MTKAKAKKKIVQPEEEPVPTKCTRCKNAGSEVGCCKKLLCEKCLFDTIKFMPHNQSVYLRCPFCDVCHVIANNLAGNFIRRQCPSKATVVKGDDGTEWVFVVRTFNDRHNLEIIGLTDGSSLPTTWV